MLDTIPNLLSGSRFDILIYEIFDLKLQLILSSKHFFLEKIHIVFQRNRWFKSPIMHGVWPVFLMVLIWPLWVERPYSVSCCPWSLSVNLQFLGVTANSEPQNILFNILVIVGWKVEPNGCHILNKACHLEIWMQLRRNFEYENKWCGEVFCLKFVGCILKSHFFGGGLSIYKRFWRRYYPGTTEVCDVPLLEVVVPNKILLLGKEMEIQNNCLLKPGVHILLLMRCTCKSEYIHTSHQLLTATAYVSATIEYFFKAFCNFCCCYGGLACWKWVKTLLFHVLVPV